MHRCTIRPCAWPISRQLQIPRGHVRLLSGVNAARTSSSNGHNVKTKRLERKRSGRYNAQDKQRERNMRDLIFLDDLASTLEAHRDYNRSPVIHKIRLRVDEAILPFKRPSLDSASSENAKTTYKGEEDEIDTKGRSSTSARGPRPSEGPVRRVLKEKGLLRRDRVDIASARKVLADTPSVSEVSADQAWKREDSVTADEPRHGRTRQWPADSVQDVEEGAKTRNTGFVRSVEPLEYTAVVSPITELWEWTGANPSTISTPWASYVEDSTGDNYERLSNEIRGFEAYMRLGPTEEAAAQLVHSNVTLALQELLSTKSLTLLGSRSTGLAAPISDFNYRIDIDSPERSSTNGSPELITMAAKSTRRRVLEGIWRGLKKSKDVATTKLIFAPVPIIKCRHRATGLRIQFETMSPSQASQQYTAAYLSEFTSLRPLYILIRHFLDIRGLTAVSRGGLGSYTILIMIVAALKHSRGEFAPDDLGGQLLHVLNFYGNANLYDNGFSVEPPRTFKKRKRKRSREERKAIYSDPQLQGIEYLIKNSSSRKPYLLCLQDPANAYNDLGRPSYAIKHIQLSFKEMHTSIKKALSHAGLTQKIEDWSFLAPMIRADYSPFEIIRRDIEDCNTPDAGLNPEDADEDTISVLLERRLKIYKGEKEEEDLPFNPENTDLPFSPADTDINSISADVDLPPSPADADIPSDPADVDLPPSPADADIPSNSADADLPPSPADTDITSISADADLPPSPADADIPSNPADTDIPSDPSNTDIPSNSSNTDIPSNPSNTDIPSNPLNTDIPSNPVTTDLKPGLITKHKSEGWYPNEYNFKLHAKQKRSKRQIERRLARWIEKMRAKTKAYRDKRGAKAAKEESPAAEETSAGEGE